MAVPQAVTAWLLVTGAGGGPTARARGPGGARGGAGREAGARPKTTGHCRRAELASKVTAEAAATPAELPGLAFPRACPATNLLPRLITLGSVPKFRPGTTTLSASRCTRSEPDPAPRAPLTPRARSARVTSTTRSTPKVPPAASSPRGSWPRCAVGPPGPSAAAWSSP